MNHVNFEHNFFGAFVMLIISSVLFFAIVWLASFFGKKLSRLNTEKLKLSIWECGPIPIKQQSRISVHFYLFALLFILFDVEIVFMYPWAVNFILLSWFGFVEMILFIVLLAIGFIYAWNKGALSWHIMK